MNNRKVLSLAKLQLLAKATSTTVVHCCCVSMVDGKEIDERPLLACSDAVALNYYRDALVLEGKIDINGDYLISVAIDSENDYAKARDVSHPLRCSEGCAAAAH